MLLIAGLLALSLFIGIFLFIVLVAVESLWDWGGHRLEVYRDNRSV